MRYTLIVLVALVLVFASLAGAADLQPRLPLSDQPLLVHEGFDHRLIVKFDDAIRVRADGTDRVWSQTGADLGEVHLLAARHGLTFEQLIHLPEATLQEIEDRAADHSGIAQPDLAGMLIVRQEVPDEARLTAIGDALQRLDRVEFAYLQILGVEPPEDIPPTTPNLTAFQTYRGPDPGINIFYALMWGVTGAGVRLSDCEYGGNADHEDLTDIDLHLEPGQTIHPNVYTYEWDEHGTAVLGETSAVTNSYGCQGMVPDAEVYTWPEWTVEESYRRVTCITNAIASSAVGDVVLLEMQTTGAGGGYGPAELDPAVWTVVKNGADAGVIVVGAAGNGNQNLDSTAYQEYMNRGDSGAIIVGAGSSTTAHNKLSFSTYGSRVNVQGWGQNVFTLGYGGYAEYGGDKNQRYTSSFSGTSSASPFVASACVSLQSLALSTTGVPLSPSELRQLLIDTGIPQGSGGHIGPLPDMRAAIEMYYDTHVDAVEGAATPTPATILTATPNPFRGTTGIRYLLAADSPVALEIYDTVGRRVRSLVDVEMVSAGPHDVTWDGRDGAGNSVAPGIYHVRLEAGSRVEGHRIVIVR